MLITENLLHIFAMFVACYAIFMYASGAIFNFYLRYFNVKKDYNYEPTVSVMLSCFNEGEAVYHTIKSMRDSDYPIDKLEILAFDDCSTDDSFDWIKKAESDFKNVKAVRNKQNQGKAHTVLDAAYMSTGDILVGVDSDCIFDHNAIRELVVCFTEDKIAAVGGRVGVSNPDDTWLSRCQTIFYALSFMFIKSTENIFRKIQCLSGPLVAIRRDRFFEVAPQIQHRHFLGVKVTNGEDRALTQMLLRKGYSTYVNIDSVCWTTVPTEFKQYTKQQLRWRRSAIGQWLDAVVRLPEMLKNNSISSAIFSLSPIFVMFSWNLLIITSWLSGNLINVLVGVVLFHVLVSPIVAIIYNLCAKKYFKRDSVKSTLDLAISMVISSIWFPFSGLVITQFALFTLDDGGWVTRNTEVNKTE